MPIDLETIALKCLRKEPANRSASAGAGAVALPGRQNYTHCPQPGERVKGKPFAMRGVYSDDDRATLQGVLARQKLPGSHWWDHGGVGGRISDKWQVDSFPTVFLLDHKGVISCKGLRGERLEKAISELLAELEAEKRSR